MSDSILESLAAQRRTAYLNQISNLELEFTRINEAFTGDDDLTAFVPVDVARAGFASWLNRVSQFPNEYRRAVQRVVTPVTRAEPQYSGDEDWSDAEKEAAKPVLERLHDLRQLLALKLALHGDAAIFPWIDEAGKLRLTPLLGFTFPVWDDMEVTKLEALLCFQRYQASSGVEFLVWEFSEGVMRRWENVRTLTAYNTQGTMLEELQPHAANRFPIAFHALTRDPAGGVTGIGAQGLSAHRRYAQRAIQENASYERAGHPQRVAYDVEGDAVNSWKAYETIQISGNGRLEIGRAHV